MPTYEYRCPEGHEFELFQRMSDEPVADCPACGKAAERLLSAGAGFLFKGDGFYITDYRSESYQKEAKAEKEGRSSSGSAGATGGAGTEGGGKHGSGGGSSDSPRSDAPSAGNGAAKKDPSARKDASHSSRSAKDGGVAARGKSKGSGPTSSSSSS